MMTKRTYGANKPMSKRETEAYENAKKKAAKKNAAPPDSDDFSGVECNNLYLAIKYESNNTFNPIWVKILNQNGDIPSGKQLVDILDQVRVEAFDVEDALRIGFLITGRKRAADKKKVDEEKEEPKVISSA
jgi:hypothetical protein